MNCKIAICDDNKTDIDYIQSIVRGWANAFGHVISIDNFLSAEEFLFHYEDEKDYDMLLLDIEMGPMNGVELAKNIRKVNREIQIIFITGYNEYIADGYEVEALHYILKPVHGDKLSEVLERAVAKIKKNEAALFFELPDGMIRIPLHEIRYIEVRSNYVTIHEVQDISVKTTLSGIGEKLDERFYKVGRSFIVNMQYIRRITRKEVVMEDGTSVPVSRGVYEPLNRAFINHF